MTITDFLQKVISDFDKEEKCGFCWNFFAPLTEIDLNIAKTGCCVNVFLVRNKGVDFDTQIQNFNGASGRISEREHFDLYFLIKSKEGINNYNEMPDHPISESREKEIFEPLRKCVTYNLFDEICKDFFILQWNGKYIYDFQDEMYYGLRISITTQKEI